MKNRLLALLAFLSLILFCAACTLPSTQVLGEIPSPTTVLSLTPVPMLTPVSQPVNEVIIFLVALEDQGQSGMPVGCNDSLVAVTQPIQFTGDPIRAALERLFSYKTPYVGDPGFYTALAQSDLVVDDIAVNEDGVAQVALSGKVLLGGVCDNPRFQGQIEHTILAAPGVTSVQVVLNGRPLSEILSGK